ncbi:MAG: DUF4173 domain-containing protein, partial [bacterium]|nr:DUF4173 domain-containing protein [bacterium]
TLLFSSADQVFGEIISKIFSFDIDEDTRKQIVMGVIIGGIFLCYFSALLRKKYMAPDNIGKTSKQLTVIEGSIALSLINILFLIFIVIQAVYLFGGVANITEQGLTYAQYAKRGFVELIFVGILTIIVIRVFETYIERNENKHSNIFIMFSVLLTAQALIVMISAYKRLVLYEQAYGFTNERLFGHGIIIWFGVLFIILLLKILLHRRDTLFEQGAFISFVAFLIILNVMNPEAFIAQKNIDRFIETGKIDVYYLGQLSEDAIPISVKLLDMNIIKNDQNILRSFFESKKLQLEEDNMSNFLASILSRYRALKTLE